jgi:hypothetical protein
MCSRDDDPSTHDNPDACPACGHAWRTHSTRVGAEIAAERGRDYVPCVGAARGYLLVLCGCRELAPETASRRQPTAGNI